MTTISYTAERIVDSQDNQQNGATKLTNQETFQFDMCTVGLDEIRALKNRSEASAFLTKLELLMSA